jgi:hypothetical protein
LFNLFSEIKNNRIIFSILIVLTLSDIITTYIGVCKLGMMEVNRNAIQLISKLGFLLSSALRIFIIAGLFVFVASIWKKFKHGKIITSILFVILMLIPIGHTVVMNLIEITDTYHFNPDWRVFTNEKATMSDVLNFDREKFCRIL